MTENPESEIEVPTPEELVKETEIEDALELTRGDYYILDIVHALLMRIEAIEATLEAPAP